MKRRYSIKVLDHNTGFLRYSTITIGEDMTKIVFGYLLDEYPTDTIQVIYKGFNESEVNPSD